MDPQFPVISRGLPYGASYDDGPTQFGAANAIDADYGSTWRSVFRPFDGVTSNPQWLAIDLRSVPPANKTNVWFVWRNPMTPYYLASATLGPNGPGGGFILNPRNYVIQGHLSSGSLPAVGDVGWTTLVTVTDNRYNQRIHTGLNLSTYNWIRFYCTEASGPNGNDDVRIQIDLRNAAGGTNDSIFVYGNSHASDGFNTRRPDGASWVVGPLENMLQTATGRVAPVMIDGSQGGYTAAQGYADRVQFLAGTPCHYVVLHFGSAEVNNYNIDLGTLTPAGVNSVNAQQFKTDMQNLIDYITSLGKVSILPNIPWQDISTWSAPNVGYLNQIIAQLVAANPGKVIAGPDEFTTYFNSPALLVDHLHPTWDNSVGAGMVGGMTGYEWFHVLWRDSLLKSLYSSGSNYLVQWYRRRRTRKR